MVQGSKDTSGADKQLDVQGGGQSGGMPASGELEGSKYNPLGNPGVKHWQAAFVTRDGLDDRSTVFFAAVEMTRMPMSVTNPRLPDNPIVFVNRAFLDLTGYREEDVVGRNCRFLQGEQTDARTVRELREAVGDRRAVAVDILNYKADGTPFWNALFIGPVFDENGEILYFFASQLDITQRRLSEQAFLQAQKMEAIGQLTAGLAHDFNNLLQVILGNLELVEQRAAGDAMLAQATTLARRAAERGGKLTQQLLTFARKQRLEPRHINLNAVAVEFSEMLVRTLGDKVDLRLDLKPGLPSCTLDPTHLEMALLNVLINARDAMPHGGTVVLATSLLNDSARTETHHLPPGVYVVICIIDKGEGMSPEVLQRATEPFFTTKGPGTGLGLAMVHGFVQQSRGRLEIESEAGRGTTVRMIFPVAEESRVPPTPAIAPPDPGKDEKKSTILLVEDSDDVRQITEAYLDSLGYHVLSAHSGEDALRLLDRHGPVQLLFTDVIMPGGINGMVLAERVRQRIPDVPVLFATAFMDELAHRGTDTSTMNIMSKPYRRAELAERVGAALNKNQPAAQRSAGFHREE